MSFKKANSLAFDLLIRIAGRDKRDLILLISKWDLIVGSILADRSQVVKLEKGILFVGVFNSVWMQELVLLKQTIIEKIKKTLNYRIKNILFFIIEEKK